MQLDHLAPTPTIAPKPAKPPAVLPPAIASAPDIAATFILFGLDQRGRPHAASLSGYEPAVVERAADLVDAYCVAADNAALRNLAAKLSVGRVFPKSGKPLLPFCGRVTYDQLLATAGIAAEPKLIKAAGKPADGRGGADSGQGKGAGGSGAGDPPATRAGVKAPADWPQIGLGSLVLAEDEDGGGYWPAKVVATKADDNFVLQWTGFPDLPEFSRARRALALLHPEAVEGVE